MISVMTYSVSYEVAPPWLLTLMLGAQFALLLGGGIFGLILYRRLRIKPGRQ
jgi:hypothetical protein